MSNKVINNVNCTGSMRSSSISCMMDWKHHLSVWCITKRLSSLVVRSCWRYLLQVKQITCMFSKGKSHQRRQNILIVIRAHLNSEYFFSGGAFTSNYKKMQFNSCSWKTTCSKSPSSKEKFGLLSFAKVSFQK